MSGKTPTKVWGSNVTGLAGTAVRLRAALVTYSGNVPVVGKTLHFVVAGLGDVYSSVTTGADGYAYADFTIPPGTSAGPYTISTRFEDTGDATYGTSSGPSTLTVQ